MEIKSIKLKFKRRGTKRIDIRTDKGTFTISTFYNALCFPYIDLDTEVGRTEFSQLEEIAYQCYYWLITDDKDMNDFTKEEWNEWLDKFIKKQGFRNSHIEELARNSFETYKNYFMKRTN